MTQASLRPDAYFDLCKATTLATAVTAQCDALDGIADGIVSHPGACHFDPTTLRCPNGDDWGPLCLSDAQI